MQQDRTFIPGLDENAQPNLYSRQGNTGKFSKGTIIPGMQDVAPSVQGAVVNSSEAVSKKNASSIPVVGFLYSISRQGIGEYWPLHIGANTIGRSDDCDVCLKEMSVSSLHARLNIKQMKSTGKLIATIRDEGSRTGLYVNTKELDYDFHNCDNGDIITIGANYQLLFILINAKELGLSVSENFVADNYVAEEMADTHKQDFTPYERKHRYEGGTVDLSGANSFEDGDGTQIM